MGRKVRGRTFPDIPHQPLAVRNGQITVESTAGYSIVWKTRAVDRDDVIPRVEKDHPVVRVDLLQQRRVSSAPRDVCDDR